MGDEDTSGGTGIGNLVNISDIKNNRLICVLYDPAPARTLVCCVVRAESAVSPEAGTASGVGSVIAEVG